MNAAATSGEISNLAAEMTAIIDKSNAEQAALASEKARIDAQSTAEIGNALQQIRADGPRTSPSEITLPALPAPSPRPIWDDYPRNYDYVPAARPTYWDSAVGTVPFLASASSVLLVASIAAVGWRKSKSAEITNLGRIVMAFKQRAALVISAGLAIIALSIFVDAEIIHSWANSNLWEDIVSDGWLSAFGAAVALVGIYHWLARPDID